MGIETLIENIEEKERIEKLPALVKEYLANGYTIKDEDNTFYILAKDTHRAAYNKKKHDITYEYHIPKIKR